MKKREERKEVFEQMIKVILQGQKLKRGIRMWPSWPFLYKNSHTMRDLVLKLNVSVKTAWRLLKVHCPKLRKMKQPSKKPRDGKKVVHACKQLLGILPVDLEWWGSTLDHENNRFLKDNAVTCSTELLQHVIFLDAGTCEPLECIAAAEGLWVEGVHNKPVVENEMLTETVRLYLSPVQACVRACASLCIVRDRLMMCRWGIRSNSCFTVVWPCISAPTSPSRTQGSNLQPLAVRAKGTSIGCHTQQMKPRKC